MVKRFPNLLIYCFTVLFAFSEGLLLIFALEAGKRKTLSIVILIPLLLIAIAVFPRIRIQSIIGFLLLVFWMPAGFDNWGLYLFEIFLYAILILLLLKFGRKEDDIRNSSLSNIPWFPFLLLIVGALLTWLFSNKVGGELNEIRAMCIVPLALSMVFFLTIRSAKDAEHYMWMLLISAAVLGLLFLLGKNFSGFISLTNYASDSGRLSMWLSIPFVGSLEMLPQSTSNWYGYLFVFAYSFWIFHPSTLHRTFAIVLCLLFGIVIISTQGRGGALQAALGSAIVSVYATFSRKLFDIKGIWFKLAIVCMAVIGGFWYLATHSTNPYFYQHGISLFVDPLGDATLVYRFQGWLNGIKLFLANPIFGIGLSGIATPWGPDTSEILNYFLLILLGYGLLGFLGIVLIFFKLLVAFWNGIRSKDRTTRMFCIASIGGMVGFFLGLQPEEPYNTVIVWAPLLIAFAVTKLKENPPVNRSNFVTTVRKNSGEIILLRDQNCD